MLFNFVRLLMTGSSGYLSPEIAFTENVNTNKIVRMLFIMF